MTMTTLPADRRLTNPVYWLMWLLPGSAVLAGLTTLFIALRSGDRPLPEAYHWEGTRLDEDFARARRAAALGIAVQLDTEGGRCRAVVSNVPAETVALNLLLTNGGDAGLDRQVRLMRVGPNEFHASCAAFAAGNWRVAVSDDAGSWSVRGLIARGPVRLELRARNPDGPAA
jgi:hypothetical protein